MATISKFFGTVALNSTTEVEVTLDPQFCYHVRHTGLDASGNDDANSALTAYLSNESATITADLSEEDKKYPLTDGEYTVIGPGIGTLYLDAATGADGILAFSRIGELTRAF